MLQNNKKYPFVLATISSENNATHGVNVENLDLTVSPGDDFYMYACGGWKKDHPISPEFSCYGTFDDLREQARLQLQDLILSLRDNPTSKIKGTNAQKVCDLFSMGMDESRLNKEGATPILPFISKINEANVSDKEEFAKTIAWLHNGLSASFFSTGVGTDIGNSDNNIMHIGEVGLGLGDRDYYLEDNEHNTKLQKAYEQYIKRLMELIGYDDKSAQRVWENVFDLERKFAEHKMTREDRRDPQKRYNVMSMDDIKNRYSNFDWDVYFNQLNVKNLNKANVANPDFLDFINELLPTLSEQQVKDYLIYDVVSESTGLLSDDFREAAFEMYGRVMSGKEEQEPRWKKAMAIPNAMLGEAVGELYVEKFFPKENKEYMLKLVRNLQNALRKHIKNLTWMSDATKQKALEKLDTFTVKIGYPDKWKDYSAIDIDPSKSYLENVYKASLWYAQDNYNKLSKPVDKTEWHMTPQTVNAYYNPTTNEICFPAAILQPPYFDPTADDALNYGAIGVVIGHEMTHGFDDSGRKFDKDGNLNDWWKEEDAQNFKSLSDKLVEQFNNVEVAPGVYANGRYTLGENIADQGGLRIALTAYLDSLQNKTQENIGGFSPLQRFYISYANVWANNIRDEEVLIRTKSDPHSLGKNRVNVTLKNISPFFEAFDIKAGQPMFLEEDKRVVIW